MTKLHEWSMEGIMQDRKLKKQLNESVGSLWETATNTNVVAATRATKMVLVTVSSTPGYFTYNNS